VYVSDKAQGDVIIAGIDPSRAIKAAALERECKTDIVWYFEASKEPGHEHLPAKGHSDQIILGRIAFSSQSPNQKDRLFLSATSRAPIFLYKWQCQLSPAEKNRIDIGKGYLNG